MKIYSLVIQNLQHLVWLSLIVQKSYLLKKEGDLLQP
jgi:hypothetical protein